MSKRDIALNNLSSEFPLLSARVIVTLFLRFLESTDSLDAAVSATRARIIDACAI